MAETTVKDNNQEDAIKTVDSKENSVPVLKATKKRKKSKRTVAVGQAHILASFNNTIITFSDNQGNALVSSSAGASGFKGSKKGTAYAAQVAADIAAKAVKSQFGMTKVDVFVKGIGLGRDSAIRAIGNLDIQIEKLVDKTGVPHGGVRPKKARRV